MTWVAAMMAIFCPLMVIRKGVKACGRVLADAEDRVVGLLLGGQRHLEPGLARSPRRGCWPR